MKKVIQQFVLTNLILIFFLGFASGEFFLILRHKSPYLSDSYFYKHLYYSYQGDTFGQAYEKVLSQIDMTKADEISRNFYLKIDAYHRSLAFFIKRPLYPWLATIVNGLVHNEMVAFLLPLYFSFIGAIFLIWWWFQESLQPLLKIIATGLFVGFYPFLDWSTYFLTDTIGFFFWLLLLIMGYRFVEVGHRSYQWKFLLLLAFSLLNREQNLLFVPLCLLLLMSLKKYRYPKLLIERGKMLLFVSTVVAIVYLVIIKLFHLPSLYETVTYTQNNYGLYDRTFSFAESTRFLIESIMRAHRGFGEDLVRHHWWLVFTILGLAGIIKTLVVSRKPTLTFLFIVGAGIASYLGIFLYPVLSYRYFYPVIVMLIYGAVKLVGELTDSFHVKKL